MVKEISSYTLEIASIIDGKVVGISYSSHYEEKQNLWGSIMKKYYKIKPRDAEP